jgi:hypothetical protein
MSTHREGRLGAAGIVCLGAVLVQAGILVAFLVGSLLLSGAQVTAGGDPAWDAAVPFPVFPVPSWLLTALALIGLAAALVWAVTARPADASALTGVVGPAVAGAFAPGFFMFAFADDGVPLGDYGIALAIGAATVIVLFVAAVVHGARADRTKSADASIGETR